ncbi:DNA (cytosine-5)-methyltransferase 1 [Bosea sp. OAE752]|uniref:DNA cytosine methyltransferase n=1 Tax=Bosea sp. OAE752 TaxID=2663873 RepID=UPI003D22FDF3
MRELIVDSFAGGGGASTGIEMALGRSPDIAINHDAEALALHRMNHPETLHLPHNVWKVDPVAVTAGRPVGLLWASPDCKHFSKAKGGRPVKRNIRDLAWVVPRWAKQVRPRVIILENVEEFRDWGPISAEGVPCKDRKGHDFKRWSGELRRLGYKVEHRELRACDYGAPTIRKRLFVIARRDGEKIVWPKPTHGKPDDPDVIAGRKLPWRTAASIIDWSLPCHSIFLPREEGRAVGVNRPLADATMARIARGVKRYVIDAAKPFVVTCNHSGDGFRGQDLGEPFKTVAAARDAHGLVTPFVTKFRANSVGSSLDEPLHTVTANGENRERPGGAAPLGLVSPVLVGCGGRAGQSRPRSADEPTATGTAKADVCIAAVHLSRQFGASIGSDVVDPVGTVTAGGGGKTAVVGHAMTEPVSTIVGKGCTQGLVTAFVQGYYSNGGSGYATARSFDEPLATAPTKGRLGVVAGNLVVPPLLPAMLARARQVAELLRQYDLWSGGEFVTVEIGGDTYIVVDIAMRMLAPPELFGAQGFPRGYILDRGLKVEVREGWGEDDGPAEPIPITKTAQVRMCGNSVCPPLAQALVAANYQPRESEQPAPVVSTPLFMEAAE